ARRGRHTVVGGGEQREDLGVVGEPERVHDGVSRGVAAALVPLLAELAPQERRPRLEPASRLHAVEEASGHEERAAGVDEVVVAAVTLDGSGERGGLRVEALEQAPALHRIGAQLRPEEGAQVEEIRDASGERRERPRHAALALGAGGPLADERDGGVVPAPPAVGARRERGGDAERYEFVEAVQRDAPGLRETSGIPFDAAREA